MNISLPFQSHFRSKSLVSQDYTTKDLRRHILPAGRSMVGCNRTGHKMHEACKYANNCLVRRLLLDYLYCIVRYGFLDLLCRQKIPGIHLVRSTRHNHQLADGYRAQTRDSKSHSCSEDIDCPPPL